MLSQHMYKFISENDLIERGTLVGCAVSGGADSVCLLHMLKELEPLLDIKVFCLHFEHGIRAGASVADMEFTREYAGRLGVPFIQGGADVPKMAVERGENLENMARKLRYAFFFNSMKRHKLSRVCLAHHSEDVAESVLLNLIRGSGISGVCGIAPLRADGIARPMLFATKQDVLRYVHDNNLRYVTDESNFDTKYSRNYLRLNILPELARINSGAIMNIYRTAVNLRGEAEIVELAERRAYESCVTRERAHVSVDAAELLEMEVPLAMRVLRRAVHVISPRDVEKHHLMAIYELAVRGVTGKKFETATYQAVLRYSKVVIYRPNEQQYFIESINIPGITPFPGGELEVSGEHPLETFPGNASLYQYVNPDKLKGAVMRTPEAEDEILPFGRTSRRKLSKYLLEKKVPGNVADLPILALGKEVLWVPGVGLSEKLRVHEKYARIEVILNETTK